MAIKPLTAEQLYDSLAAILIPAGRPARGQGGKNFKALRPGAGPREQFVAFFEGDENISALDYQSGIPQVLRLMNAPQMNNSAGLIAALTSTRQSSDKVIEQLYLTTLARRPTTAETSRLASHVGQGQSEARQAYSDILWALLNSSEFTLNH